MSERHREQKEVARAGALKYRAVVALLAAALLLSVTAEGSERRVRFGRGQTKVRVSGRLTGMRDRAVFILRARSGQHMRVKLLSSAGPIRCFVATPTGAEQGQPGTGLIFDEELTETGDYRIRLNQSPMGERWRGRFLLEIEIK